MQDVPDPFVERQARADAEDQDRDNERPQIKLHPIAERVPLIGLFLSQPQTVEQQRLVAGVDPGVDRLRQHRRRSRDASDDAFADRDQAVADQCRVADPLRMVESHATPSLCPAAGAPGLWCAKGMRF